MKLLEKIQLGNLALKNRMIMSAMTRSRADQNGIVGDMTVQYYTQRVSAGLLFTEAIRISEEATGSPLTPGIYSNDQIEAWKKVTKSVHDQGGLIIAQLWHTGRVGHSIDRDGKLPLAPSALPIQGMQHFTSQGLKDYEKLTVVSSHSKMYSSRCIIVISRLVKSKSLFDGIKLITNRLIP